MSTERRTYDPLLITIDTLLTITLLILPLAWGFGSFHILASPIFLSVSWGIKPYFAPVILLALRIFRKRHTAVPQAPLLDLADRFAAPEYDAMFMHDGIHLESDGLQAITTELHKKLVELANHHEFNN